MFISKLGLVLILLFQAFHNVAIQLLALISLQVYAILIPQDLLKEH